MASPEKLPFLFLGRKLGMYDNVDILPENGILVFGFVPNALCKIPAGDILIDVGRGTCTRSADGTGPSDDLLSCVINCETFTDAEWNANDEQLEKEDTSDDPLDLGPTTTLPTDK